MKKLPTPPFRLTLAALALLFAGCAMPGVNPSSARANTGYVDFIADSSEELYWQVEQFDDRSQQFKIVFAELNSPQSGFLRLPFVPGPHRLRVTFMNRVIEQPAEVAVEVQDGRITPVHVTLTAAGTALLETKEYSYGGTAKGRYGRRSKTGSNETILYSLSAVAEPIVAYQLKERMSYAR